MIGMTFMTSDDRVVECLSEPYVVMTCGRDDGNFEISNIVVRDLQTNSVREAYVDELRLWMSPSDIKQWSNS